MLRTNIGHQVEKRGVGCIGRLGLTCIHYGCVCVCVRVHACVCVCVACVCVLGHSVRLTLCNSVDYSPSDSSVHGIIQTRMLQ